MKKAILMAGPENRDQDNHDPKYHLHFVNWAYEHLLRGKFRKKDIHPLVEGDMMHIARCIFHENLEVLSEKTLQRALERCAGSEGFLMYIVAHGNAIERKDGQIQTFAQIGNDFILVPEVLGVTLECMDNRTQLLVTNCCYDGGFGELGVRNRVVYSAAGGFRPITTGVTDSPSVSFIEGISKGLSYNQAYNLSANGCRGSSPKIYGDPETLEGHFI